MKKRILIAVFAMIISVTIIVLSGFDKTTMEPIDNGPYESYAGVRFLAKKVPNERVLTIDGNKILLKYDSTINTADKMPEDREDKYGTYDEYVDDEGNIYSFLHNTNLLCGILNLGINKQYADSISEDTARNIAELYLNEVLGVDAFKKYTYDSIIYDEGFERYILKYYYPLGNMKTDDEIYITIDNFGNIISLSALNLNKYAEITIDTYDIEKTEGNGMNYLSNLDNSNVEIQDIFISMDYKGRLTLTYIYTFANNEISQAEKYDTILIKK